MGNETVRSGELDRLGDRDVPLVELELRRRPDDLLPARLDVQYPHRGSLGRRRRREDESLAMAPERRREARIRELEPLQFAARRMQQGEAVDRGSSEDTRNPPVLEERVTREVE